MLASSNEFQAAFYPVAEAVPDAPICRSARQSTRTLTDGRHRDTLEPD
jgi:hypothetical protein